MEYIGVDVSKQDISVFDHKGLSTFKNEKGLKGLNNHIKKHFNGYDDIVIIFESTGVYSDYLKEFCSRHKIKASIVNPKKSSNFAKAIGNRSKTDKIDAHMLYRFKDIISKKDILIPQADKTAEKLSLYLTSYEFILKRVTSIANHIEALKHKSDTPKDILSMFEKELKHTKKMQDEIMQKMEKLIENNKELKRDYENLLTITGIGKISAIALLTFFSLYENANRSQITALAGIDPIRCESGTSLSKRKKISKSGNNTIRKILYFPMLTAIRYNKKIKAFYDRLVENHKPKKLALIAAMRKMILIAHSIYKNKTVFCDDLS